MKRAELESTAYHEAGHAVAAWALGVKVRHVSVLSDGDSLGRVQHASTISKRIAQAYETRTSLINFEGETSALRTAVISLAGLVAQRKHAPRSVRSYHGHSDYHAVLLVAERVGHDDEQEMKHWYRRALRRTERVLDYKWRAVEALAKALVKKRELSGKEALAAIRSAYELTETEQRRLDKIVERARIQ